MGCGHNAFGEMRIAPVLRLDGQGERFENAPLDVEVMRLAIFVAGRVEPVVVERIATPVGKAL